MTAVPAIAALTKSRAVLRAQLEAHRPEIEQAVAARVHAISDPREVSDSAYLQGLHAALTGALDYALDVLERGERGAPDVPASLLVQARMAGRNGVALDTVLRRYFAGYSVLTDFIIREAEDLQGEVPLQDVLRSQAAVFDRLLAAVSCEHGRETHGRPTNSQERRRECVERLLAGELVDHTDLGYDMAGHHLGLVAHGAAAAEAFRELARAVDRRQLTLAGDETTTWAWLGGRRPVDLPELKEVLAATWPPGICLALGEPADGLAGWRLTHQQAKAALPIALRRGDALIQYADVALLASMLQDDLLLTSLRELYLAPLLATRDGGEVALDTLHAYFAADRNLSSAAAMLGVSRHTVANRIRVIERRLGRPFVACAPSLEAVLWTDDLSRRHTNSDILNKLQIGRAQRLTTLGKRPPGQP